MFRNEVFSPDAICFAPKGRGRFPGFKKKSFKLSRLLSFFAKESSISLTLTVPFIVACGERLCTCSFMVEQNRLLASRQRRSPSSVVVLDCSQCPFSQKIDGIKHMSLHTTILVSNALTLAWGLVPRGLPFSVHLKFILRPVMVSVRSYGKSRGLFVTMKSLFFSLSSFPRPFGSSLGCTELSQIVFFVPWIRRVSVYSLKKTY